MYICVVIIITQMTRLVLQFERHISRKSLD